MAFKQFSDNHIGKGVTMNEVFMILAVVLLWTLPLLWVLLSIKIIGPAEMAVKVYFGVPFSVCDSGIRFVPWFFGLTYVVRYPKRIYNFEYEKHEVVTKAGWYSPKAGATKDDPEEPLVYYGAEPIEVESVVYLNFPRERDLLIDATGQAVGFLQDKEKTEATGEERKRAVDKLYTVDKDGAKVEARLEETHPLIKILRAGVPIEFDALRDWIEEAVESALRVALGKITWKQAQVDMACVVKEVNEIFAKTDGALIKAGFRPQGIKLSIEQINYSDDLLKSFAQVDKARLFKDAAGYDAEAQAIDRVETILYVMARTQGVDITVVKEKIKGDTALQAEILEYAKGLHADLEKADRSSYFKFDSSSAGGIDKGLQDLFALVLRGIPGKGQGGAAQGPSGGTQGPGQVTGFAGGASNQQRARSGGGGNSPGGTYEESAEEVYRKTGKYPTWDPLKRTPN